MNKLITSYFRRYSFILLAIVALVGAYNWTAVGTLLRGCVMIPMFGFIALGSALLFRHLFNRSTTDAYVSDSAGLKKDWGKLSPYQRLFLTKLEFAFYFLGACLLGAGLLIIV